MKSIFLEKNHLFLRAPDGGVEDVASMKAAGFGAIFCNIGDYSIDSWSVVRRQAEAAGVVCGPWLRTTDDSNTFSYSKLSYLVDTADRWQTPFIVNSESELKGSGAQLTQFIAGKIGSRDAAMSVEAWPFDNVSWVPLAEYPFLPQIFPQEGNDASLFPYATKDQWHKYGIKCVVFSFGSYHDMPAQMFDRLSPFGVYTADDINGNFQAWAPMGMGTPCVNLDPLEILMDKIGTSDGIKSFVTWLKKQPGVQTGHGPKYDPNKPSTWPWPERLERTLTMLRQDHDKG